MTYILVKATYPPDQMETVTKTYIATHIEYPAYLKKIVDMGAPGKKYKNYVIYQCNGPKVVDAINVIWVRFHKMTIVHNFKYEIELFEDTADTVNFLK